MPCLKLLKGVKRQLLGTENLFRYKTRTVNHLYLFYCIFGKIFSTGGFNLLFKLVFWSWHFSAPLFGYATGLIYLRYGDKKDFIMLLYNWFTVCLCTFITIVVPLASHWYAHNIESMFDVMDKILSKKNSSKQCLEDSININKILTNDLLIILISGLIFSSTCIFDVLLFYEDYKVRNYMYYVLPLINLKQYGSRKLLIATTAIINLATALPIVEVWTILKFFEIWAAACHHKVMFICEEIKQHSTILVDKTTCIPLYYSTRKVIAQKIVLGENFKQNLMPIVNDFQEVTRLVEIPRKYYQIICALIMVASFISQLTHAYIFLATDLAFAVKCKEMALFIFTAVLTFIVCRVGEVFDDLTSLISFEIYNTPWYILLPSFRKDILMILCQAQKKVQLKAMGVYSINVNMFLRLLNSIFSTTNILAKLMRKHSSTN